MELPAHMLGYVASVGDLGGPDNQPLAQSLHGVAKAHNQHSSSGYNSIEKQPGKSSARYHQQQQQQQGHHRGQLRSQQREENLNSGQTYPYKIDTFSNFGTVTCYAENSYGNSGPCYYHILAAGTFTGHLVLIHALLMRSNCSPSSPTMIIHPNLCLSHRITGSSEELYCLQHHLQLAAGSMSGRKERGHTAAIPRGGGGAADEGTARECLLQDARVLAETVTERHRDRHQGRSRRRTGPKVVCSAFSQVVRAALEQLYRCEWLP